MLCRLHWISRTFLSQNFEENTLCVSITKNNQPTKISSSLQLAPRICEGFVVNSNKRAECDSKLLQLAKNAFSQNWNYCLTRKETSSFSLLLTTTRNTYFSCTQNFCVLGQISAHVRVCPSKVCCGFRCLGTLGSSSNEE